LSVIFSTQCESARGGIILGIANTLSKIATVACISTALSGCIGSNLLDKLDAAGGNETPAPVVTPAPGVTPAPVVTGEGTGGTTETPVVAGGGTGGGTGTAGGTEVVGGTGTTTETPVVGGGGTETAGGTEIVGGAGGTTETPVVVGGGTGNTGGTETVGGAGGITETPIIVGGGTGTTGGVEALPVVAGGFVLSDENVATPGGEGIVLVGPSSPSKAGATAINSGTVYEATFLPCTQNPINCAEYEITANRPRAVTASVTIDSVANEASSTLEGQADVTSASYSTSGQHYITGENQVTYGGFAFRESSIGTRSVQGVDEFFFFDAAKYVLVSEGETHETEIEARVAGVQGKLSPEAKVKTATFKGMALGRVVKKDSDAYFTFVADSTTKADLETKKLTTTMDLTEGMVDLADRTTQGVGTKVLLTGVDIYGNTFSGGTMSIVNADGTTMASFAQGDAMTAGGFYGDNAEYAAGVFSGVGSGSATQGQILLEGDFWGRDVAQPPSDPSQ
jgi:hypothetical protein